LKIIKEISAFQSIADYHKSTFKTIGFVPTMGFLHEGHISLIMKAREECDIVIVSIFVNPSQFGENEDFAEYPRDLLRDFHICKNAGVDYVFQPEQKEMYPDDFKTEVRINEISDLYEGRFRPGHFTGVATVVLKLINIVKPSILYLGQKDAQQVAVIKKMIIDLNLDVKVSVCETYREDSGLATSSRNTYLSGEEKLEASVLYQALCEGKKMVVDYKVSDFESVKKFIESFIKRKSQILKVQYIAVTDSMFSCEIENLNQYKGEIVISLAAYLGKTRLIDNILINN